MTKSQPWARTRPPREFDGSPDPATAGTQRHEPFPPDDWGVADDPRAPMLIGRSSTMGALRWRVRRVAPSSRPVLLYGPSGAGKELAARALHHWSGRREEPFVDVNCATIPEHIAESELFGCERGAFTGADRRREGFVGEARGGTLFLDEVTELPLRVQAKLLRVLETERFRPLGGGPEQAFSARVIAATNADLAALVKRGEFREDLYYRLRVLPVEVPALASRREDVPQLADHFLRREGGGHRLSEAARAALGAFDWPGNVRQLRNVVARLVLFSDDDLIDEGAVRRELTYESGECQPRGDELQELAGRVLDAPSANKLEEVERAMVDEALRRTSGNKSEAARLLGVHRKIVERRTVRGAGATGANEPAADAFD